MHTFSETGAGVPAFLAKLWRLVEDPETNHLIYWSRDGRSFIIQNQAQFARELLPLNYKHNNMASFIRQLNMYGFHKITSIDNGGLKFDRDEMEFSHPCFKRGCPYLLEHIKRKIATQKGTIDERAGIKPEAVNKVLSEVKLMRGRQDSLDSRFSVMKQENEALWREIASLRQKHMKQQQIVNKLIQFLVTIVQPSRNMSGVKRHFQLMINDAPQSSKVRKRSESESGPVIHELTEELLDEVVDSDTDLLPPSPNVLSPGEASSQMGSELADELSPKSGISTERPHSNPSVSSQHFDLNNDEDTNLSGSGVIVANNGLNDIVYHIREIPDGNDATIDSQFLEENVLTPLVKQEMARNQELQRLKRKSKQHNLCGQPSRRSKGSTIKPQQQQDQHKSQKEQQQQQQQQENKIPKIKTENDIDPLMFLDVSEDGQGNTLDADLLASANQNNAGSNSQTDKQMYASGDFISAEMPADLFEEPSMIDDMNMAGGSYNPNINLRPPEGGKLLSSPSLSSAATSTTASNSTNVEKGDIQSNEDQNNLTLTKYNSQKYQTDEDIMRLSTPDEFNSHLDNVQDDLDNLKDILRSDGYSLDANTLLGDNKHQLQQQSRTSEMNATSPNRIILSSPLDGDILAKLFSDSDILAPYGLSISSENLQDMQKKGSELMTYQPYYTADLSDILDINNAEEIPKTTDRDVSSKSPAPPSSVLNTPYPERD